MICYYCHYANCLLSCLILCYLNCGQLHKSCLLYYYCVAILTISMKAGLLFYSSLQLATKQNQKMSDSSLFSYYQHSIMHLFIKKYYHAMSSFDYPQYLLLLFCQYIQKEISTNITKFIQIIDSSLSANSLLCKVSIILIVLW